MEKLSLRIMNRKKSQVIDRAIKTNEIRHEQINKQTQKRCPQVNMITKTLDEEIIQVHI